jgi:hypothetical protein
MSECRAANRPSAAQRRYLERGLAQPGGKRCEWPRDRRRDSTCMRSRRLGRALVYEPDQAGVAGLQTDAPRARRARVGAR